MPASVTSGALSVPDTVSFLLAFRSTLVGEVMHPFVLGTTDLVLQQATNYQLHLTQAISIGPGQPAQPIHRDRTASGDLIAKLRHLRRPPRFLARDRRQRFAVRLGPLIRRRNDATELRPVHGRCARQGYPCARRPIGRRLG